MTAVPGGAPGPRWRTSTAGATGPCSSAAPASTCGPSSTASTLPGRWPAVAAELDGEADEPGGIAALYARLAA